MLRIFITIIALLLLTWAQQPALARPAKHKHWQRHEAVCQPGQIAVCAAPISRHQPAILVNHYKVGEVWRISLDIASGLDARHGAEPICSCVRKAQRGSVTLTCACTGGHHGPGKGKR